MGVIIDPIKKSFKQKLFSSLENHVLPNHTLEYLRLHILEDSNIPLLFTTYFHSLKKLIITSDFEKRILENISKYQTKLDFLKVPI